MYMYRNHGGNINLKKSMRQRWFILIIPFLLGTYGYSLLYGNNLPGAMYSSLRLYSMNIDVPENTINIYIQIARWLAAMATTSIVVLLFQHIFSELGLRKKMRDENLIVVHGDGARKEIIANVLGESAITMSSNACFGARKHVLAFDTDAAAIRYLQENESKLFVNKERRVYFSSDEYEPSDYAQAGLCISNNAVNCARLYWKNNWLRDERIKKVAIIGFGKYGQRLLEQALLVNVIAWRRTIEYHIFGCDGNEFIKWHPYIGKCISVNTSSDDVDSIHFHSSIEQSGLSDLEEMDRIIISLDEVEKNILCLNRILTAGITGTIHVRCNEELLKQVEYLPVRQQQLQSVEIAHFGDDKELYSREVMLHGKLTSLAKEAHITYVRESKAKSIKMKYRSCDGCKKEGRCGACEKVVNTWDDLIPLEKASNIAVADHEPVKREMLLKAQKNCGLAFSKKELCRIEHNRWCRFYYLHNWDYGNKRDYKLRQHPDIIPFNELPADEQEKDWWAYESLLNEVK